MRKLVNLFGIILAISIALISCEKDDSDPIPKKIISFEVSPDSVEVNGLVEIDFETSNAANVGYSTGWGKEGGEFLYTNCGSPSHQLMKTSSMFPLILLQ